MPATTLPFAVMAERKAEAATIGLRLDPGLLARLRIYANHERHGFRKPSLTSCINQAMSDFLDKHEPEVGIKSPKPSPPRR